MKKGLRIILIALMALHNGLIHAQDASDAPKVQKASFISRAKRALTYKKIKRTFTSPAAFKAVVGAVLSVCGLAIGKEYGSRNQRGDNDGGKSIDMSGGKGMPFIPGKKNPASEVNGDEWDGSIEVVDADARVVIKQNTLHPELNTDDMSDKENDVLELKSSGDETDGTNTELANVVDPPVESENETPVANEQSVNDFLNSLLEEIYVPPTLEELGVVSFSEFESIVILPVDEDGASSAKHTKRKYKKRKPFDGVLKGQNALDALAALKALEDQQEESVVGGSQSSDEDISDGEQFNQYIADLNKRLENLDNNLNTLNECQDTTSNSIKRLLDRVHGIPYPVAYNGYLANKAAATYFNQLPILLLAQKHQDGSISQNCLATEIYLRRFMNLSEQEVDTYRTSLLKVYKMEAPRLVS